MAYRTARHGAGVKPLGTIVSKGIGGGPVGYEAAGALGVVGWWLTVSPVSFFG